jgi:hypothetical protein
LYHINEVHTIEQHNDVNVEVSTPIKGSPLYLELHYLVTPSKKTPEEEHALLGQVMQIFHDNPILRRSILQGTLKENNEELRITIDQLSIDELDIIWSMLNKPYKLSIGYTVTPVRIESKREIEVQKVVEKKKAYKAY